MELYEHQKEALRALEGKNRCAVYYDMGLGKTFIGSEKMAQLGAAVNLVICQKSKINDWIEHLMQYYETDVFDLTKNKGIEFMFNNMDYGVPVTGVINYELVWRRPELLKLHDFTLMLDESSLITNRTAKRSAFILKLRPANVILLSGTPTAGKYENLWSQLQLLGWNIDENTYFKSYVDYEWFETGDGYFEKRILGYKNVNHLKRRLAKFGAIFKKTEEVLDLPDQVDQMIYIDQSNDYKQFCKHSYVKLSDNTEITGDTTLTQILGERQLCAQYNLDKIKAFKDLLESTEDRLIVFYNFNEELYKLGEICDALKRPISVVNGKLKTLDAYNSRSNSVTFVQYKAGAYGLNLQKANKIVYFSLPLGLGSCDLWEQSKKRIHRIGQDHTCFYYYLLVKDSIETWNLELLRLGKELTDYLFENKSL